jgi:CheY-like chemotaxis protein
MLDTWFGIKKHRFEKEGFMAKTNVIKIPGMGANFNAGLPPHPKRPAHGLKPDITAMSDEWKFAEAAKLAEAVIQKAAWTAGYGRPSRHVSSAVFSQALERAKETGSFLDERRHDPEIMGEINDTIQPLEASAAVRKASASQVGFQGTETVLVVCEEPMLREMIAKILRQLGYGVLEAAGAEEARYLTRSRRDVSLLLADFSTSETNGLELVRWFQRKYPRMKVLITTDSVWDLANQVGEHEQVAILLKPFDNLQLGRMVRLVLG